MQKLYPIVLSVLLLFGCKSTVEQNDYNNHREDTDSNASHIEKNAKKLDLDKTLTIDHSRLAARENQYLAPSRVAFFNDDKLNTQLLKNNPQIGLDLPFRVLSYVEEGKQKVIYTDAKFLKKRHGITDEAALSQYESQIKSLVNGLDKAAPVPSDGVTEDYGIEKLVSVHDFKTTIKNIKKDVLAQDDTIWFMNWDYRAHAHAIGESLTKATLLVFGGPVPGAKSMENFPSIGLDAFGQKVLVTEENGQVVVRYNNIVSISKLHYGHSSIAHRVINYRLQKTLGGAVK